MKSEETTGRSDKSMDEPLTEPTGDLLDMDQHAQALARYIRQHESQVPFTVGIFGEWGEGKTTLVRFLAHHLSKSDSGTAKPIKFVSFSAWPYTTSEKLWRALILDIAKVLYGVEEEKAGTEQSQQPVQAVQEQNDGKSSGVIQWAADFLTYDFLKPKEARKLSEYEAFVQKLEETDYGRISKRTPNAAASQEAVVSAVLQSTLGALSAMSPVVSGLRRLLPIDRSVESLGALQASTDENSVKAIEALPNFQQIFKDMVKDRARSNGESVYVFIDDLDRAQPDVALDIMESIRIALSKVECVFIIAVDERLIAQGLRLRYRDLFAENSGDFATKGQEYLEKIIQFRTRVPPRTAEQTQRLIAAQFPHWTPAGDIIQSIAGNNPRRIKQYCQRLSFQRMAGSNFRLGSISQEEPAAPESLPESAAAEATGHGP